VVQQFLKLVRQAAKNSRFDRSERRPRNWISDGSGHRHFHSFL